MRFLRLMLATLLLSFAATHALAQQHVVYHFDDASTQAMKGLRNIRNHLDGDPTVQITVVALGPGIDLLAQGYKDANASDYAAQIATLKARGVKFEACENTMKARGLKREQLVPEADTTSSGVVRVAKLQGQGFAYIKP